MSETFQEVLTTSATQAIIAAEVDQQITTAKRYPRSIGEFQREAEGLATSTGTVADDCMYAMKRKDSDGKHIVIKGPSVRLAEILLHSWSNARAGSRIISEDDRFITAQGFFYDLERNIQVSSEVRRRISGRRGKYNDDMVGQTANAAGSIARRNAILAGIPRALWQDVMEAVERTIKGDQKTFVERRAKVVSYLESQGAKLPNILYAIGVITLEDIGLDELVILRGMATAIKDAEATVADSFPDPKAAEQGAPAAGDGLKAAVAKAKGAKEGPGGQAGDEKAAGSGPADTPSGDRPS